MIASGQIVQIHTLDMGRPYPVTFARRLTTQFGPTVLLTLQADETINIKFYLPRRYAEGFGDQDIEEKIYKLIYKGRCGSAYILNMVL